MQQAIDGGADLRPSPRDATQSAHAARRSPERSAERVFLNLSQAASVLGVSERKFHELRVAGLVPEPLRLGERALRWHRDELIEHARQHAPRGNGEAPAHLADPEVVTKRKATMRAKRTAQAGM